MLGEVFAAVGELRTVQSDSHKECAEGEFFVVGNRLFGADAPCGQCVVVQRNGKSNVAPDLTGMRGAVKGSQFDCVMTVEKTMEITKVIAAGVVMIGAVIAVAFVPDILDVIKCFRLALIVFFTSSASISLHHLRRSGLMFSAL